MFADGLILKTLSRIIWVVNILKYHSQFERLIFPEKVNADEIFLVLNGPSLADQDILFLKNKTAIFVNRGFKHKDYHLIKPRYHAFVDNKFLSGAWPLTWIDDILKINPGTTFIMPVEWSVHPKILEYKNKNVNIYWINTRYRLYSLGVSGVCFEFAINHGVKNIYFTGFDGNGIAHELVSSASHFYGQNSENSLKSTVDYAQDLYMHSRHFLSLNEFSKYAKMKGVKIYNMTNGGVLDMFQRIEIQKFNQSVD